MPEGPRWGLSPEEALACLGRILGRSAGEPGILDDSPEALAGALGQLGIQARPARIRPEDWRFLQLPTLVRHLDGSWIVLKGASRKGALALGAAGPALLGGEALEALLSGQVLDLAPALPEGKPLWTALRTLMGSHARTLGLILGATVALQLLGLAAPVLAGVILNRALPDGAPSLLALVTAGTLLAALFQAWIGYVRGRALLYFSQRMDLSTERGFLEHLLGLPFSQLRQRSLGEWLQAFGGFAAARDILAEKTLGVFLDGALAVVLLGTMACLLPGAAAAVAATALAMALGTILAGRVEARLQAREVEVRVQERGYLSELLLGIATLKAAGTEEPCLRRWRRLYRSGLLLALRRGRIGLWASTGLGALGKAADAAILVWGGLQVLRGTLSLGAFLAFLQLASGFLAAVVGLAETWLKLLVLKPQLAKAAEVLDLPREERRPAQRPAPEPRALELEEVGFRYRPGGPWVLDRFSLRVEAGAKHRIERPSGWGKSTFLRLLAGLEQPERGQVLVGGRPPAEVRHAFIYLPQFVQLCSGSILENLRLLSGGAAPEQLLATARATGLDAWVEALPMGYRTILPSGGRTLSGGQRQWVALTAALAAGRGVLILDEPTASMDGALGARLSALLETGPWTVVLAGHGQGGR